ncbi:MAG TPA: GNAT family N-acetyltransferase [Caulobacteraceae bacterium]|nr:GNAT family N-acetyltransferase [Caulobacteraceae bacterium]
MIDPHVIEPISARGWPAAESAELGGWRLHASAGQSGRINTCWALEPPDRDIDLAIAATEAWYAARGLPPKFKIVEADEGALDLIARLRRRGYVSDTPTLTMAGPLVGAIDPDATIAAKTCDGFARVFADPSFGHEADAAERLAALARIPPPRGFALIRRGGEPAAVGACAVDGQWAGVMGMRTAPAFRRQGLARRLFRTLTAFAATAGARHGYLQVDQDNASAIALYEAEGFEAGYLYRYWSNLHP